jgi:hypothetical protein
MCVSGFRLADLAARFVYIKTTGIRTPDCARYPSGGARREAGS